MLTVLRCRWVLYLCYRLFDRIDPTSIRPAGVKKSLAVERLNFMAMRASIAPSRTMQNLNNPSGDTTKGLGSEGCRGEFI